VEIIFIRHGQPAWSVNGMSQPDPHLTDLGHQQAELAARRLATDNRPITDVVVSPAHRARETAIPIAGKLGINPTTIEDITEIRMPDWSNQLEEAVQRIFSEARHRSPEEWWDGLDGGESFRAFHDRVTKALLGFLADRGIHPDTERAHLWRVERETDRIAFVAHAGTNAVAIGLLLGIPPTPWEWERFILYHASFARLRTIPLAGAHVFSLRTFNDREHLPAGFRTR
jgi:probable phosphoglycerate mutase